MFFLRKKINANTENGMLEVAFGFVRTSVVIIITDLLLATKIKQLEL